ncbi:MAG: PEGA domain-containing protein [Acidobacteriaceae bacterium]|nr:PEGA domain-containing protein [Acidobacteriaceae bacterium]
MKETSLEQLLSSETRLLKPVRLAVVQQIASELDKQHHDGRVHGNLSPRSIVLTSDIADSAQLHVSIKAAGISWAQDAELATRKDVPEAARYMSPERILGIDPDGRSDQFSLAAITYELICGRKAFDARSVSQLFYQICSEDPPSAQDVDPSLNRAVAKALSRALSKDRQHRFSTSTAFVEALSAALEDCEGWAVPVPVARAAAVAAPSGGIATPGSSASEATPVGLAEPQSAPLPSYDLPAARRPRFYRDEEEADTEPTRPLPEEQGGRKWLIIAALTGLLVGAILFLSYFRRPELPVQVAETNGAPMTPPPPDMSAPVKNNPAAPVKPLAEGRTPPRLQASSRSARSVASSDLGQSTDEPVTSSVELLTDPPGAKITLDGNSGKTCTTPCTLSLPTGRHTLSAQMEGYSGAQRIFNLPHDDSVFVQMTKQTGTLVVTSVPSGSTILVDGRNYGVTPASLRLAPGRHEVTLLYGSRRHVEGVQVQADAIQAEGFTW